MSNFMKFPFKKIYWFRYGLFFGALSLFLYTFSVFYLVFYSSSTLITKLAAFIWGGPGLLINLFGITSVESIVFYDLMIFTFWFVVGSFLGWAFGKLKNRNHAQL